MYGIWSELLILGFNLFSKITWQNHLILILTFSNQNQMILSYDFRKIESFDSDFIFKDFKKLIQSLQLWQGYTGAYFIIRKQPRKQKIVVAGLFNLNYCISL